MSRRWKSRDKQSISKLEAWLVQHTGDDSALADTQLIASIPEFPESRKISFSDKPLFDALFFAKSPEISSYTFTNIFAWREAYQLSISRFKDSIIICHSASDKMMCWEPFGESDPASVIEEAFRQVENLPLTFERISKPTVDALQGNSDFIIESNRSDWDYVYLVNDLINLTGGKYDSKRNFINRIRSKIDYKYIVMDQNIADKCIEFSDYWCEERSCKTVEGMRRELCATYEILSNFEALGVRGGAISIEDKIVAFSVGEALNPETFVIHLEKASSQFEGLYPLINQEFCIHAASEFRYINREQDLGVPGLRKAKESYHPVRMIETYRIVNNLSNLP